ncbi:MAG TPA: Rieske 2Fe-2S domain-containing protein [Methylomirabilota bacterium]|nr:Rieske 2Fe-2S domain-containing protein [Methylomirabilota bacterium]
MGKLAKVGETSDLAPGQGKVVEAEGKTIGLFNVDGTFYALDNTCVHRGGPLGEGELDGKSVICPWHGWYYDVTDGTNVANPTIKVACYPVKVEGTAVFVEI